MSLRQYIVGMVSLIGGFWLIPGIEEAFKVYVTVTIFGVSFLFNLLIHWGKLRQRIITKIYLAVLMEMFQDPEIRKMIGTQVLMNLIGKAKQDAGSSS